MRFLFILIGAVLSLAAGPAQAQEKWPQRTVTLVVPFAAGGSTDLIARILAQHMQTVSLLATLPNLLFINPKIPANNVAELVAYLKNNEGNVNFGSSGNGTSSHLSAVMFQLATGTKMTHVPFRSTNEVMNSIIGGQIKLAHAKMTTALAPTKNAGGGPPARPP